MDTFPGPCTSVVGRRPDGQILMSARRYDHTQFGLPGGKVEVAKDGPLVGNHAMDPGFEEANWETIREGAAREFTEETGIWVSPLSLRFVWFGLCENQTAQDGMPRFWPTWTFVVDLLHGEDPNPAEGEPPAKWGTWDEITAEGQPFEKYNKQVLLALEAHG